MAEIKEIVCDVSGCKRRNAQPFAVFSHRAFNGMDSDNWDHVFDLCPDHIAAMLTKVLKDMEPEKAKQTIDAANIKSRLG